MIDLRCRGLANINDSAPVSVNRTDFAVRASSQSRESQTASPQPAYLNRPRKAVPASPSLASRQRVLHHTPKPPACG